MFERLFHNNGVGWTLHSRDAAEAVFRVFSWARPELFRWGSRIAKRHADDLPVSRFFYRHRYVLFIRDVDLCLKP